MPGTRRAALVFLSGILVVGCAPSGHPGAASSTAPTATAPATTTTSPPPAPTPPAATPAPTPPPATTPAPSAQAALAADESVVAGLNGDCAAFQPSGSCAGLLTAVSTPNGYGATLYGIELAQTSGDSCTRGSVYFFDDETLLRVPAQLAPLDPPAAESGMGDVSVPAGVSVGAPGEIAVAFAVSTPDLPGGGVTCAGDGNAGTDVYVYREAASGQLAVVAGHPPSPPEVIGPGPA